MTATELIEQLQKQVEEHGDIEVYVYTNCGIDPIFEVYDNPLNEIIIRVRERI